MKRCWWIAVVLVLHLVLAPNAVAADQSGVQTIMIPQTVHPLPGSLDRTLVVNSNSPEVVQSDGILVSTLPPSGKVTPAAHLNVPLNGRFDVFLHHIARADDASNLKTLYVAVLLANTGTAAATVDVLAAASYLSQPDAPFVPLPAYLPNDAGNVYAGPGDRVTDDVLRGLRQPGWPDKVTVPAGGVVVLQALPIPVAGLTPPLNGRSLLAKLKSNRPIYAATLAMFARTGADGLECAPTADDWRHLLQSGALAGPREKPASPPGSKSPFSYGRVAGVQRGSQWTARIRDFKRSSRLTVDPVDEPISYPISTVEQGTLGTGQIQSAPLIAREPDTAYAAHGNYAVRYALDLPLYNGGDAAKNVSIKLQTPLKQGSTSTGLLFFASQSNRVFFRGTVRLDYLDDSGRQQQSYIHVVQHQGEQGKPLVQLSLKPHQRRDVHIDFLYPPDATPPQVVTVE